MTHKSYHIHKRENRQIRTGYLFVFVCLLKNGIRSHCSQFTLTPPPDSIITLRVYFDLTYNCLVYIKLLMQKYILGKLLYLSTSNYNITYMFYFDSNRTMTLTNLMKMRSSAPKNIWFRNWLRWRLYRVPRTTRNNEYTYILFIWRVT